MYHIVHGGFSFQVNSAKDEVQKYVDTVYGDVDEAKMSSLQPYVKQAFQAAAVRIRSILKDATVRQDKRRDSHKALTFMEIYPNELPWIKKDA